MKETSKRLLICFVSLQITQTYAESNTFDSVKKGVSRLLAPEPTAVQVIDLSELSGIQLDTSRVEELPVVGRPSSMQMNQPSSSFSTLGSVPLEGRPIDFINAIHMAVQRRPEISQSIAEVASQGARIDVARAGYYPKISGGIGTADLTKGERGRQLINLEATQLLYDFGKTKSSVDVERARLAQSQARVLSAIDDIAYQVADSIVNVQRYREVVRIADEQIKGIGKIAEITDLRAQAGISSQADPVQAKTTLEAAQSNKIVQETQLRQYLQRLRTLLGYDVSNVEWTIPDSLVTNANLYQDPEFNRIPDMLVAQLGVELAKQQKEQTKLTAYPTLSVKGTLSQAINGRNPNNNKDDGFYNSIMLEASSNFYQGGAISAQTRSASYAEEAAKSLVNSTYLDVVDRVRLIREEIENKQRQMSVLNARKELSIRTKELYQEQYKLGTRSAVDLLNAEQAIHSAAQEIETARYDIYSAIVQYIQITGRSRELYNLNNMTIQGFEIQP